MVEYEQTCGLLNVFTSTNLKCFKILVNNIIKACVNKKVHSYDRVTGEYGGKGRFCDEKGMAVLVV
jgi:hypothetical protein